MKKNNSTIDWDNLTFSFRETDRMYISTCKQGEEWSHGKMQDFENLSISPAAGVLNYGQGLFEGMKAYRAVDGSVVLFRPKENARRMQRGARRLGMPEVPEDIFIAAVIKTVQENSRWIPPIGKGTLYIRPLLMGSGPILGVSPAPEYTFLIYVA
jgi:branched-chain amino acid aminotransferase